MIETFNQDKKWSFAESYIWGNNFPRCMAKNQSPIDINTANTQICNTLCDFTLHYKPSSCKVNFKNNQVIVKYGSGSFLEYQNILYELKEIHVHVPTLHSIDGSKYDLELLFIHKISDNNTVSKKSDTPNGVILSRLYESGPHHGGTENFLNQFINEVPKETSQFDIEIDVSDDWSASMCQPKNRSFYMYDGSLPFPPCDTNYKVIVYEDIGSIGRTNLDIFKHNIGSNTRILQETGDRTIMYKPYNIDFKEEVDENDPNDRYLKCKRNTLLDFIEAPTSTTEVVEEDKDDTGLGLETISSINNVLLGIILIFLLIVSYYFIKYLFKNKISTTTKLESGETQQTMFSYGQFILLKLIGVEAFEGTDYKSEWNDDNCPKKESKTQPQTQPPPRY